MLLLTVKLQLGKLKPPKIPISGVIKSLTNAWMTVEKAAPITTATARSTKLPRSTRSLNPLNNLIASPPHVITAHHALQVRAAGQASQPLRRLRVSWGRIGHEHSMDYLYRQESVCASLPPLTP